MTQTEAPSKAPHFTGLWMHDLAQIAHWIQHDDFLVAPSMVMFLGDDMMLLFTMQVPEDGDLDDVDTVDTEYAQYAYRIEDGEILIMSLGDGDDDDEDGDDAWGVLPFAHLETGGFALGLSERLCNMQPANLEHARDMGFAVEFMETWQEVGPKIGKPFDPQHSYPMTLKSSA